MRHIGENERPKQIEVVLREPWLGEPFAKRTVKHTENIVDDIVSRTNLVKKIHFRPELPFVEKDGIEISDKGGVEITVFTSERGQTHTQYYACFDMMETRLKTLAERLGCSKPKIFEKNFLNIGDHDLGVLPLWGFDSAGWIFRLCCDNDTTYGQIYKKARVICSFLKQIIQDAQTVSKGYRDIPQRVPNIYNGLHVFICYSWKDREFVTRITRALSRRRVPIWHDQWEVKVGDFIAKRIEEGFREAKFAIVVLSNNFLESAWANRELQMAISKEIEENRVFILPILKEKCKIPTMLQPKKYADFSESFRKGLAELMKALGIE